MGYILVALVIFFLSGCVGVSSERNYSTSGLTDNELLLRILNGLVVPASYNVYADDHRIDRIEEIELEDVVNYDASCVIYELRSNATGMDLEVIYGLWVKSDGSAQDAIINSLGRQAYQSGVEAYANATFDCGLAVSRWLDEMEG